MGERSKPEWMIPISIQQHLKVLSELKWQSKKFDIKY